MAIDFGEKVWLIVNGWNQFQKDTIGKQLVRAADSIAANLSEGLGRYHFKEAKNFAFYARGSLFESKTWITKSYKRQLLDKTSFDKLMQDIEVMGKMINGYIKSIGQVNEPLDTYGDEVDPNAQSLMPNP